MHEAFLQAIRECPGDDAPRLVYADWLEDHGDPERAEFIRRQVALAREAATGPPLRRLPYDVCRTDERRPSPGWSIAARHPSRPRDDRCRR